MEEISKNKRTRKKAFHFLKNISTFLFVAQFYLKKYSKLIKSLIYFKVETKYDTRSERPVIG